VLFGLDRSIGQLLALRQKLKPLLENVVMEPVRATLQDVCACLGKGGLSTLPPRRVLSFKQEVCSPSSRRGLDTMLKNTSMRSRPFGFLMLHESKSTVDLMSSKNASRARPLRMVAHHCGLNQVRVCRPDVAIGNVYN
jgi:hypothetical protein